VQAAAAAQKSALVALWTAPKALLSDTEMALMKSD